VGKKHSFGRLIWNQQPYKTPPDGGLVHSPSNPKLTRFFLPPEARAFQRVYASLRNRCKLIFKNEEDTSWSRDIPTAEVEQAGHALLSGTDQAVHEPLPQPIESVNEFLAHTVVIIGAMLDESPPPVVEHFAENDGGSPNSAGLKAFLTEAGVPIDKYGFAWVVKDDRYFRVNLRNTEVYLFLRDEPEICCRVCIVASSCGMDIGKRSGFNQDDILVISKIFALAFDSLPETLSAQVDEFVASRGTLSGTYNLNSFDPLTVFSEELQELNRELYQEMVRKRDEARPAGTCRGSLIAELEAALARRRREVYGEQEQPPQPQQPQQPQKIQTPEPTSIRGSLIDELERALVRRRQALAK
jgi:hypothetical protein